MSEIDIIYSRISDLYDQAIPKRIGAYVITHTFDNIHAERYVGATSNLYKRLRFGHCNKKIVYIDMYVTNDEKTAQSLERILMHLIKPATNVKVLYLSIKDKELMDELLEDVKTKEHVSEKVVKIGCRYLKLINGNEIDSDSHKHTETKCVQIEEEVHVMLKNKNKEFKEKNNYELPLGIIIGKVCRKYLKDMELV